LPSSAQTSKTHGAGKRSTSRHAAALGPGVRVPVQYCYGLCLARQETEAFAWLNKAIDVHDLFLPESFFDPLRTDPRYAGVLKRMGLP
jgi:hypothetical protein